MIPPTLPCPLCGAPAPFETAAFARDFYLCGACELLSVRPDQMPSAEACRERYLLHQTSEQDAGYLEFLAPAIVAVSRAAPPGARVLDFGCGRDGVLANELSRRDFRMSLEDPLFHPAASSGETFDCVVAVEVFEHFQTPAADIAHALSRVAPGGHLVVMTLLRRKETELASWWYLRDSTHVAFYTLGTFEHIARANGLALVATDGRRLLTLAKGSC